MRGFFSASPHPFQRWTKLFTEAVRLTEGDTFGSGSVEVWSDLSGVWGSVCGVGWDERDANIVCRQLGFPDGAASGRTCT